jgi:DNA polymerase-3 subunit delta'
MKDFIGNAATIKYLEASVSGNSMSHAYLFCGPKNVGKTKAGEYVAKLLLCESVDPQGCTGCTSCKLIEKGNHPDFFHLDNEKVLVDEVRDLVSSLDLKSYFGKGKVALISHAENLTNQALNSFLKTLEEPSAKTTIILTSENPKNLLPTIVSRARQVNFGLSSDKQIYELLNGELGVVRAEATLITGLAAGRPGVAVFLSNNRENVAEMNITAKDFNRIYRSTDIYEKISYAEKMSKEKDSLSIKLDNLELMTRAELMNGKITKANKAKVDELILTIDNISKSRDRLAANANAKLVIEGLLIGSIS